MLFWFFRDFSVIFWIFSLLLDFEFFFIFLNLIFFHFFSGLISISKDYMHQIELNFFLVFLIRLIILFLLNSAIELFF
uniref:Succinate dehydrogenase subunit 4 n=1 Tax=Melanothamnus gigas TaxID=3016206 RepID=A0A9F1U5C6_9FLOR|nr:Succinate dehydrogenase subunit 4 [Melanothamnus gigas]WAX04171.1 Succinate dehydrogenase subunit 4 [Melanothamnus gigas]